MLKHAARWLLIAVSVLAIAHAVVALAAEQQKDGSSSKNQGSEKPKDAKSAGSKDTAQPVDPSQYVGAETCKTCHEQVAAGYEKGPHGRAAPAKHPGLQWQGCEACHGPGKAHAESADPDKIIRLNALSSDQSSKRCVGCHEFREEQASSLSSEHAKHSVGCIDCHSIHTPGVQAGLLKATLSQLCNSCHLGVKPDLTKPFHHRVQPQE